MISQKKESVGVAVSHPHVAIDGLEGQNACREPFSEHFLAKTTMLISHKLNILVFYYRSFICFESSFY
jgi:hypothetical protein